MHNAIATRNSELMKNATDEVTEMKSIQSVMQ